MSVPRRPVVPDELVPDELAPDELAPDELAPNQQEAEAGTSRRRGYELRVNAAHGFTRLLP